LSNLGLSYALSKDLVRAEITAQAGLPAGANFPSGSGVLDVYRQRGTSFALFTHQIVSLNDWLSLVLGLRYTRETKSLAASITTNNPGCAGALAIHGRSLSGVPAALQGLVCGPNLDPRYDGNYATDRAEENLSGTAAINGKLSESLNAYLTYGRGYKGGGYELDRSGMNPISPSLDQDAFRQETTDSFEGGLREVSTDGIWRASAALFHTSFSDYQFSYFTGFNRRMYAAVPLWRVFKTRAARELERSLEVAVQAVQGYIANARAQMTARPQLKASPENLLQALLAATRVLPWNDAEPCCELSAVAKLLRVGHRGRDGRGNDRTDPGDAFQPATHNIRLMPVQNLCLDCSYLGLELLELLDKHCHGATREVGNVRCRRSCDQLHQVGQASTALRGYDPELVQLSPEAVGQHASLANEELPCAM
jgi:hypothetical protein